MLDESGKSNNYFVDTVFCVIKTRMSELCYWMIVTQRCAAVMLLF